MAPINPRAERAGLDAASTVEDLRKIALVSAPAAVPQAVASGPDGNRVLAAAVAGNAELIVSDRRNRCHWAAISASPSSPRGRC